MLEKNGDVCEGTSKANSGIAHGGYDALPGTMKARMNKEGIRMMEETSQTLDFEFHKIGSLVLCHSEEDRPALQALYERGVQQDIRGLSIVERDDLIQIGRTSPMMWWPLSFRIRSTTCFRKRNTFSWPEKASTCVLKGWLSREGCSRPCLND